MTNYKPPKAYFKLIWFTLMLLIASKSLAEGQLNSETSQFSLWVTLLTMGYMLILIVLTWINYDQRRVADNEFKNHREQLENLIFQRAKELELKNKELENKISEIKALQNSVISQKKLASLGKLSAGIAHEIKNPLNMIINSAKTIVNFVSDGLPKYKDILERNLDEKSKKFFVEDMDDIQIACDLIISSGQRANSVINNMLSQVSRIPSNQKLGDITENIDESLDLVYHTMRALYPFNVEIIKNYEDTPKTIFVHSDMGRVFINLFENSFYAMKEKLKSNVGEIYKPKLSIMVKSNEYNIDIRIQDNGIGIKEDILDNIMEPFFTTKPPGEGTGLGLSMVNDIISSHNGHIKIDSVFGEYTTVHINLPLITKE